MTSPQTAAREHELVAAEVRAHLARRQMPASHAAAELGWTQTYMSRRIRGDVSFSISDLIALGRLLKVRVTEFLPEAIRKVPLRPFLRTA